jgi:hypothetical protein
MHHAPIDDEMLRCYLAETLPAEGMARVEKALRDSAELRQRLEDVRADRGDVGLHSLGAIWRRNRLTCPSRQQLGGYLLETLDPAHAEYITFHINVVQCAFCRANLADLRSKAEQGAGAARSRRQRYFHSSRHLLSGES